MKHVDRVLMVFVVMCAMVLLVNNAHAQGGGLMNILWWLTGH